MGVGGRYEVWLIGFGLEGRAEAHRNIQRVFGVDERFARALVGAVPCAVKRGLPRDEAQRYVDLLVSIGARVELRDPAAVDGPPPITMPVEPVTMATLEAEAAARAAAPPVAQSPPPMADDGMLDLAEADDAFRVDPVAAPAMADRFAPPEAHMPGPELELADPLPSRRPAAPVPGAVDPASLLPAPAPRPSGIAAVGPAATPMTVAAAAPPRHAGTIVAAVMLAIIALRLFWTGSAEEMAVEAVFGGRPQAAQRLDRVAAEPQPQPDYGVTAEAREFLSRPSARVTSETLDREQLQRLIDDLYAAGAPRVVFAGIETVDDGELSAWLVVELPATRERRREVLATFDSWTRNKTADHGQRTVDLALD